MAGKTTMNTAHGKAAPDTTGPIILPGRSNIKRISELKESLNTLRDTDSAIAVDASEVESIDTAVLQLLVAFTNSMRLQSRTIEWKNPSAAFRDMADLADLSQYLGLDDSAVVEDVALCPVF